MKLVVSKSSLTGAVRIPASKSHTIRAVAIAALAEGTSTIKKPLVSRDTLSAVSCYQALGAEIDTSDPAQWKVTGNAGKIAQPENTIDVGNSGTTLRIAVGSASLAQPGQTIEFTGDKQVQSRPLDALLEALNQLGAKCVSVNDNGMAPVKISGKLKGGKITLEAPTSQFLTSLLLCAPMAETTTEIEVSLLNEPGYVKMTLDWLDKQQIHYASVANNYFLIPPRQSFRAFSETINSDFSSATFILCAAALAGKDVKITGLDFEDSQPDKAVVDYLKKMNADITVHRDHVLVNASTLKGAKIDLNATPDALPAMAVTAAFASGPSKLYNVEHARKKETDRIKCMSQQLGKLGVKTEELPDGLVIEPREKPKPEKPKPINLKGYDDHRIVMALSVAALMLEQQCVIDTAEAIDVTFPGYVDIMKSLGANLELTD